MSKDRSWMYGSRDSSACVVGVFEFCNSAEAYKASGADNIEGFYCPCVSCANVGTVETIQKLREHVLLRGFRADYQVWVYHGEEGVYGHNCQLHNVNEVNEDDLFPSNDDVAINDEREHDEDVDRVDEMMKVVEDSRFVESISEAAQQPLYAGCTKLTTLSAVLELYNIKSKYNWCDTGFTELLDTLSRMFPEPNELPKSNYYAKKLMCPFGLAYEKIHACPNDCVLYRNEYESLEKCPKCELPRYERKGARGLEGPPAKVLWYLPIIPRYKRLFSIKKDAINLRWHAEGRKKPSSLL